MTKKVTTNKPNTEAAAGLKQMKVFLNTNEHAVVTTAARMAGATVSEYMKQAVLEKAKRDAKDIVALIDKV